MTIKEYHIEIKLQNQRTTFQPRKKASAKSICHTNNGDIYSGGLLAFNPIQTNIKSTDTPIYAVLEDGSRQLIDAPNFWSYLVDTDWVRVLINLDTDELGDPFDEEMEDRIRWIRLVVPATEEGFTGSFEIISKPAVNKSGRLRSELKFLPIYGTIEYIDVSSNYGLNHPTFKGLPSLTTPTTPKERIKPNTTTQVARAASTIIATTPKEEIEVEEVIVNEKDVTARNCSDVEALFATSTSIPSAPVGDFGNEDEKITSANNFW